MDFSVANSDERSSAHCIPLRKCGPVWESEIDHKDSTVILVTTCVGSMMKQACGKVRKVLDLGWS
jgi:hypothetical protein